MLEPAVLESTVLEFRSKSFSHEESIRIGERDWLVFARSETESESKFRPKVLRLRVVVPADWVFADPAGERLLLGPDGSPGAMGAPTEAVEVAAEPEEFTEQGIDWVRWRPRPERLLYLPRTSADELRRSESVLRLGQ
ncbi:MAG TPA: hypothetical protein VGU43_04160 [Thermoplasmata archaeon]|nr:hypothetical protein [Thermoplasmata archaeon]